MRTTSGWTVIHRARAETHIRLFAHGLHHMTDRVHPCLRSCTHPPHTLMTLLERATHLQELANGPRILEAVDTYYADTVTIVEGDGETFHGRETQKERIREWQAMVTAIAPGGGVQSLAVQETAPGTGVVFVETSDEITFGDGSVVQFDEVAVQRWEDGHVVHERFYHNMPMGDPTT